MENLIKLTGILFLSNFPFLRHIVSRYIYNLEKNK